MTEYLAGFATADITPPVGTPIGGNFRGDYASRGVHMALQAHAMVVKCGGTAVALVSADLLVITERLVAEIRDGVERQCGLPATNVLVAATHTHSGPALLSLIGEDPASEKVVSEICRRIVSAVCEAWEEARPAELFAATFDEPRLSFNRRLQMKDGSTRSNWAALDPHDIERPLGPADPQGCVLAARHKGRVAGMLVNFTLHPAVLAGDNWDLGPDWPGYLREALCRLWGHDAPILFFNGAEGNINHLDAWDPRQGRGVKEAQRIGYVLAGTVATALHRAARIEGPVAVSRDLLFLRRRRVAPAAVAAARQRLDALGAVTASDQIDGMPAWFFDRELVEHACHAHQRVMAEVQTLRIGEVGFVALPGEFFVEFGLRLKHASPARTTVPVGLANGAVGYVPTPEALEEGGYEGQTWRYNQLDVDTGERVVQSALCQLNGLFGASQISIT